MYCNQNEFCRRYKSSWGRLAQRESGHLVKCFFSWSGFTVGCSMFSQSAKLNIWWYLENLCEYTTGKQLWQSFLCMKGNVAQLNRSDDPIDTQDVDTMTSYKSTTWLDNQLYELDDVNQHKAPPLLTETDSQCERTGQTNHDMGYTPTPWGGGHRRRIGWMKRKRKKFQSIKCRYSFHFLDCKKTAPYSLPSIRAYCWTQDSDTLL